MQAALASIGSHCAYVHAPVSRFSFALAGLSCCGSHEEEFAI